MPQDPKNPAWYTWPLPHLRPDAPFVNLPLIDENNKLFYWFKTEPQKFINLQVVSLIRDLYFSKKKQLIEDAHLPCLEFFVQKNQLFRSFEFLHHLESALENLWISMAKIDYFHQNSHLIDKTFIIGFFYTEMEYIFINARSFFDALQTGISQLFSNTWWPASKGELQKVRKLPLSFSGMYEMDSYRKIKNVKNTYNIPSFLKSFYEKHENAFFFVRTLRDMMIHEGKKLDYIFHIPSKGFGISIDGTKNPMLTLIKAQNILDERKFENNNIAPALPILAYCLRCSIETANDLTHLLEQLKIKLPQDVAPGYHVYFRSPYSKYYNVLETIISENIWSF